MIARVSCFFNSRHHSAAASRRAMRKLNPARIILSTPSPPPDPMGEWERTDVGPRVAGAILYLGWGKKQCGGSHYSAVPEGGESSRRRSAKTPLSGRRCRVWLVQTWCHPGFIFPICRATGENSFANFDQTIAGVSSSFLTFVTAREVGVMSRQPSLNGSLPLPWIFRWDPRLLDLSEDDLRVAKLQASRM